MPRQVTRRINPRDVIDVRGPSVNRQVTTPAGSLVAPAENAFQNLADSLSPLEPSLQRYALEQHQEDQLEGAAARQQLGDITDEDAQASLLDVAGDRAGSCDSETEGAQRKTPPCVFPGRRAGDTGLVI